MLAAIWLVVAVVQLLIAALVPAAGPVWSYKNVYGVVLNLFFCRVLYCRVEDPWAPVAMLELQTRVAMSRPVG
jgi:hypothetical protein